MFGKSSGKQASKQVTPPVPPPRPDRRKEQSLLQTGVSLKGEMQVDGDLRVEGRIDADLDVRGTLLIGGPAEVEGQLLGQNIVIHGRVSGTLRADEQIRLAEGARVRGDLYCKSLVIEEGVIFEGRSHMGESQDGPADAGQGRSKSPKTEGHARTSPREFADSNVGSKVHGSASGASSPGGAGDVGRRPSGDAKRETNTGAVTSGGKTRY